MELEEKYPHGTFGLIKHKIYGFLGVRVLMIQPGKKPIVVLPYAIHNKTIKEVANLKIFAVSEDQFKKKEPFKKQSLPVKEFPEFSGIG